MKPYQTIAEDFCVIAADKLTWKNDFKIVFTLNVKIKA